MTEDCRTELQWKEDSLKNISRFKFAWNGWRRRNRRSKENQRRSPPEAGQPSSTSFKNRAMWAQSFQTDLLESPPRFQARDALYGKLCLCNTYRYTSWKRFLAREKKGKCLGIVGRDFCRVLSFKHFFFFFLFGPEIILGGHFSWREDMFTLHSRWL